MLPTGLNTLHWLHGTMFLYFCLSLASKTLVLSVKSALWSAWLYAPPVLAG